MYPNGGSETYIFNLAKVLRDHGHEVQFFGMADDRNIVGNSAGAYTDNMEFQSAGYIGKLSYPFKIIYSFDARKKIGKVLDDFEPDVVHLNNINFQITPSIIDEIEKYKKRSKRDLRLIYTAHDYQWVCPNHMLKIEKAGELCNCKCVLYGYRNCFKNRCIHNSRLKSFCGMVEGWFYKRKGTYKYVDKIICPSFFMERQLNKNRLLNDKTVVLRNFITIDKEKKEHLPKPEIQDLRGRNIPDRYVLYFGRMDIEKGIINLLEAAQQLPEIPIVIAGNGTQKEKTEGIVNTYPVAFQTGEVLKALIQNAEFTVHPAIWYENCPFAVMESQINGTPVVASKIGGIPELVNEGVTGDFCNPSDTDDLVSKVRTLWYNRERIERYRDNCREWAINQFPDAEEYYQQLMNYYK